MARCGCAGSAITTGVTTTVVATNGGTTTVAIGTRMLYITPAGTIASHTIDLPDSTLAFDNEIIILTTQTITTLSVTASGPGTTVAGMPTTLSANGYFRVKLIGTVWYRVG
jgi:hypothetical protein